MLTRRLEVQHTEGKGRRAVAAHKQHAGELLWTEEPYVQVLDNALIQKACEVCYASLPLHAASTCGACGRACFCSAACASTGGADHAAECSVMRGISATGSVAAESAAQKLRIYFRLLHRASSEPSDFEAVEARLQEHFTDGTPEQQECLRSVANLVNRCVPMPCHSGSVAL